MSQKLKRLVRPLAAAVAMTLILGIAAYLYGRPDPARADDEQYKILSDYISTGLTGDSHDLGSRDGLVVILGHTTVTNMLVSKNRLNEYRELIATLPHARRNLALTSQSPILSLLVRNLCSDQHNTNWQLIRKLRAGSSKDFLGIMAISPSPVLASTAT